MTSSPTDFHLHQFLSNFFKYSFSNFPSSYPNNIFAIYFPSNLLLLNSSTFGFNFIFFHLSSIPSCLLTSTLILSSNLFTNSLTFSKSSFFSHVLFSAINPFQRTKYLSTLIFFFYSISSPLPIPLLLPLLLVLVPLPFVPSLVSYISLHQFLH